MSSEPKHPIPIQLIVGLGNPGAQYEATRHNAGAWLVNALAAKHNVDLLQETKFHGLYGSLQIGSAVCKLLLPTTFMNLSGRAVQALAHFYKIPHEAILVAHDELDFSPGIVRLKFGGGANGQKGVQNTIEALGNKDFYRLRIGIGRPVHQNQDLADYVLARPSVDERIEILHGIKRIIDIVPDLLSGQIQKATQTLHIPS